MTKEQYQFSNMFWCDPQWNLEYLPKQTIINENTYEFEFLSDDEMKEFMKLKVKEDPIVLNSFRYKKLCRILKIK